MREARIGKATAAVWARETGHAPFERPTQVPVVHSVSFGYDDLAAWRDVADLEQALASHA